ncbi:hypothetical protein OIU84_001424 [Salix udensis]|uniref:Atos-like conserved domain-containing protein n=1 Tax=Salix udensis TaxID=889485 RepID=A0AAD6P6V2_9ROSI|nr:hypothetical protein OIU84_001424 [Salix udensis]KAJ6418033.1 hypothetical protein OIU84_001424 [Salix udensis]
MGLPQLSSSSIAEEVATSFSTIVQASPQNCWCEQLRFEWDSWRKPWTSKADRNALEFSFTDSQRKTIVENKNGLLSHKSGQNVQTPVPRIIVTISSKAVESSGSDKKRLLSPLSRMLHPDQFNGAALDIGDGICKSNLWASKDSYKVSMSQEHKKAHIGNSSYSNWSTSCLPEWKNSPDDTCRENSLFFSDGPVLETDIKLRDHFFYPHGLNYFEETTKVKHQISAIAIPLMKASPPLSLSPLGPKLSEGKKSPGAGSNITKEFDDDYLTFTDIEQSLNGTVSGILSRKDGGFKMLDESLDNFDNLRTKFDVFIPEIASGIGQPWCEDSNLGPLNVRSCRSFTGVPVRRSLVGSFEESLISGHLSSGKVSQRIDGFLAVLNITGGNFSPKTQKLPFTVTSMDGNSYLLYYASIGLAREYASKQV